MNYSFSRREFNRVKFREPIQASIEVATSSFKKELEGDHTIYVIDMSAGGLRFVSRQVYLVNYLKVYKIMIRIDNRDLIVFGKIIRKRGLIHNFFEYGMQFSFDYS